MNKILRKSFSLKNSNLLVTFRIDDKIIRFTKSAQKAQHTKVCQSLNCFEKV